MSLNDGLAGWLAGLERGVITVAKRSLRRLSLGGRRLEALPAGQSGSKSSRRPLHATAKRCSRVHSRRVGLQSPCSSGRTHF